MDGETATIQVFEETGGLDIVELCVPVTLVSVTLVSLSPSYRLVACDEVIRRGAVHSAASPPPALAAQCRVWLRCRQRMNPFFAVNAGSHSTASLAPVAASMDCLSELSQRCP